MNTPELKVGQKFLSRMEADNELTEVTVKQVAAGGKYIKCSWRYRYVTNGFIEYDERTQWLDTKELLVLHIFEESEPSKEQS